jgi:lysozyme
MKLSPNGRARIQRTEGLSLTAYPDTKDKNGVQLYSIGYGHLGAKKGDVITRAEAERLFDADVAKYELIVSVTTPVATQAEFDAMVSLAYNIGTAGFAGSTVARLHNARDRAGAADAFRMWNLSDGSVNPNLVARREVERGLYLYGYDYTAPRQPAKPKPAPLPLAASMGGLGLAVAVAALAYFTLPRLAFTRRVLALGS